MGEETCPNACLVPHTGGSSGSPTKQVTSQRDGFAPPRRIPQTFAWGSWKENGETGLMPWPGALQQVPAGGRLQQLPHVGIGTGPRPAATAGAWTAKGSLKSEVHQEKNQPLLRETVIAHVNRAKEAD